MTYTPTTWATGDTITAEKLNNMEQGIESARGGLVTIPCIAADSGIALTMTVQQILDGIDAGNMYAVKMDSDTIGGYSLDKGRHFIYDVYAASEGFEIITYLYTFTAATAGDYPSTTVD